MSVFGVFRCRSLWVKIFSNSPKHNEQSASWYFYIVWDGAVYLFLLSLGFVLFCFLDLNFFLFHLEGIGNSQAHMYIVHVTGVRIVEKQSKWLCGHFWGSTNISYTFLAEGRKLGTEMCRGEILLCLYSFKYYEESHTEWMSVLQKYNLINVISICLASDFHWTLIYESSHKELPFKILTCKMRINATFLFLTCEYKMYITVWSSF